MNTVGTAHTNHSAPVACPNCGAHARPEDDGFCRFCQAELPRPQTAPRMAPPPMMGPPPQYSPPLYPVSPPIMAPYLQTGANWSRVWVWITIIFIVSGALMAGISVLAVSATDSPLDWSPVTTKLPDPTPPPIEGDTVSGTAKSYAFECDEGQNYTVDGVANAVSFTGHCGTIIVKGTGLKVTVGTVDDLWVTGTSDDVHVDHAGTISAIGTSNKTVWAHGLGATQPSVRTGGTFNTIIQG